MGRPRTEPRLPTQVAIQRAEAILASMEADGADFVGVDKHHMFVWCREQLVNIYQHRELIQFLSKNGYLKPRTENKMIIAAWIIFESIKRCE